VTQAVTLGGVLGLLQEIRLCTAALQADFTST